MLDAAALAEILDPERTIEDWWDYSCPECGDYKGDHSVACFDRPDYTHAYYGPPDLHTAREHAWRLEDWLEARGYCWFREEYPYTKTHKTQVYKRLERTHDMAPSHQLIGDPDPNHTAALAAAIERIAHNG